MCYDVWMEELRIRSIRITDSAYAAQNAAAEREGMPWSIWARRCLMQAAGQQALEPAQADEVVARATAKPVVPTPAQQVTVDAALEAAKAKSNACTKRVAAGVYCKECGSVHE